MVAFFCGSRKILNQITGQPRSIKTDRQHLASLTRTGYAGLGQGVDIFCKSTAIAPAAAELLPWPFGPHVTYETRKSDTTRSGIAQNSSVRTRTPPFNTPPRRVFLIYPATTTMPRVRARASRARSARRKFARLWGREPNSTHRLKICSINTAF